jgi:hypothetical protein
MFNSNELNFLQECVKYVELSYTEKSSKNLNKIPNFYLDEYRPKLDTFNAIKLKLNEEQKKLKGEKK